MLQSRTQNSSNEANFILLALKENQRTDGRQFFDFRTLKIRFQRHTTGQAEAQLGETRVMAVVHSEIVAPYPDRPTEGFYIFNVEFSPMADPSFDAGRPSENAVELIRVVERVLRESRAIDTEALCLVAGQKVLSVRVDIHILDNDGNLIDCASIATIAALLHFRRPYTTVHGNDLIVHSAEDKEPVPLSIHHTPICITFAFFHDGNVLVVDTTQKEEAVMDGRMTIAMNSHREICVVQKAGGVPITYDQVAQCSRIAAVKVAELTEILQNAIKAETQQRKKSPNAPQT